MNKATINKVYSVISGTIDAKGVAEWTQIRDAISSEGVKVKNWLEVRGVLQWMINHGEIERLPGVHREEYKRKGEPPPKE